MTEKKEQPRQHELRDQPVPPVKGAVTVPEDIILRPDRAMQQGLLSGHRTIPSLEDWV